MSFLDHNLDDVPELSAKEDGEYELRITDAEIKLNENANSSWFGSDMLIVRFEHTEDPDAKDVTKVFRMPPADMNEKETKKLLREIKHFAQAFGVTDLKNVDDLVGATGWAMLKVTESEQYGEQNDITRFVVGS